MLIKKFNESENKAKYWKIEQLEEYRKEYFDTNKDDITYYLYGEDLNWSSPHYEKLWFCSDLSDLINWYQDNLDKFKDFDNIIVYKEIKSTKFIDIKQELSMRKFNL